MRPSHQHTYNLDGGKCLICGKTVFETMMNDYGKGDNSVTDRVWYELAGEICIKLDNLRTPLTSRLTIEAVRQILEKRLPIK